MTHQPYLRSHGYDPRGPGADERFAVEIEVQVFKTRDGWVVNLKVDGRAEAVYGWFRRIDDAYLVAGEMANAARAGRVVRGSLVVGR